MKVGVGGSFDIASNISTFAARIYYTELYDETTGKHILNIGEAVINDAGEITGYDSGIRIKSTEFGYEWYPNGEVTVDGETVGTMNNSAPASHQVSLTAGPNYHKVKPYHEGKDFPWASSEIMSDETGNRTVEIAVDFLLYKPNVATHPSFKGSFTLELTPTARHYVLSVSEGVGVDAVVIRNDEELENGATITHGDELEINFSNTDGYKITEQTVNGEHYPSGDKHTVTGDVIVVADARVVAYAIGSGVYYAYIGGNTEAKKYVAYIGNEEGKPVLFGQ